MTDEDKAKHAKDAKDFASFVDQYPALVERFHLDVDNDLAEQLLAMLNMDAAEHPKKQFTTRLVASLVYVTAHIISQRTSSVGAECKLSKAAGEYLHVITHALTMSTKANPAPEQVPTFGTKQ